MPDAPSIDVHTHILPERWPDLKARYGYGGFVQLEHDGTGCARMTLDGKTFRVVQRNCWDPKVRLEECDAAGVRVQVLSTVPVMFAYWAAPRDALDLARMLNDHIAEVAASNPRRFVGLATVPLQDPQLAARELERAIGSLGLAGVEIGSHVNAWNLDAEELFPFFETASQLGASVFVHPWDMLAPERMERYWLKWLVGMPTETCLAICSMVMGGVLERLPNLRVAFAHGGGSYAWLEGRIDHGFRVRPDLCATHNSRPPSEYRGRFYVDSLVHDDAALRYLIQRLGCRRVLLGSDYPFPLGEHPPGIALHRLRDLGSEVQRRVRWDNALEFLALDSTRFLPDAPRIPAGGPGS